MLYTYVRSRTQQFPQNSASHEASLHNTRAVHFLLDEVTQNSWTARYGQTGWPLRSRDLAQIQFFVWINFESRFQAGVR